MLGQFKTGDTVRVKSYIENADDLEPHQQYDVQQTINNPDY